MFVWGVIILLLAGLLIMALTCHRLRSQLDLVQLECAHQADKLAALERELADVKMRRKRSFAASTQALIVVEEDYTISSANKVARRLFGKPGKKSTLMTWIRQYGLQHLVEQVFQGKKMPPLSFNFNDLTLEAHTRFIKENKQVIAVALAINDITKLQYLNRARRDFVANISHELRTPLASIQLLTETLMNGAVRDKEMAPVLIEKITMQTDTLIQLAQELLDLSMIESGQAPLKLAPCSLLTLIQTQIEHLRPQVQRKNLTLNLDVTGDIKVLADDTMVGRVIANLVHNATKFTKEGSITISIQYPDPADSQSTKKDKNDWVTVVVSDTGVGIPTIEIDRIFERFYIVDRARSKKGSGTGLGLAIAKHIVEAHGGHIWAESNGHSGTTFYFTLLAENAVPVLETTA